MTTQPGFPVPPVVPDLSADDALALDPERTPQDPEATEPTLVTTPDHLERGVQDERPVDEAGMAERTTDDRMLGDDRRVEFDDEA